MQLEKSVDSAVMVGVGTKKIFGVGSAYHGPEVVLYRCENGYLYKNGEGKKKNRRVM